METVIHLVAGCLIGILIMLACDAAADLKFINDNKKYKLYGAVFVGLLLLVASDYKSFANPGKVSNLKELLTLLLHNGANIRLIVIGTFGLLVVANLFIVRIPFTSWETVKIGIFEAKRLIATKEVATEELIYNRRLEWLRTLTFETISSEEVYERIEPYVEGQDFDGQEALKEIIDIISLAYQDSDLSLPTNGGVIPLTNGQLSSSEMSNLPNSIKEAVHSCMSTGRSSTWENGSASTVAVPVSFTSNIDFIIYLSSNQHKFGETDEIQLSAIINVVKNHVQRAVLENLANRGQDVVTSE